MIDAFRGVNYIPNTTTVVALGAFDGVHRGHREVLTAAAESGFQAWAFTFSDKTMPKGKEMMPRLTEADIKYALMKECGIEHCYAPDFDDVCDLTGEEFARDILKGTLNCKMAFCGSDFRFGKDAAWGVDDLRKFGDEYGFFVEVVDKVKEGGQPISSTRIRKAVLDGDMEEAEKLLGYPFCIYDEIVEGKRLGRTYEMPTINQKFDGGYIIPKYGVYASAVLIDGKFWPSVTNVGIRPTVDDVIPLPDAETNIIGFSEDMYGKTVPVFLLKHLRDEIRFDTLDELFDRIRSDRSEAGDIALKWINKKSAAVKELLGERD